MNKGNKVLACVDRSQYAEYVADYGAWAAKRMGLSLEFLHVIDRHPELASGEDRSGAIGVNAQANLLDRLSAQDELKAKEAREQGRLFLAELRNRVKNSALESVDVRQRNGELEQTLAEQEKHVQLMVLGRRGESTQATNRDLGRNVERVLRALHKPVLTVTDPFKEPKRVLIAYDGGSASRKGVELVATSPLFRGLSVVLLMSGRPSSAGNKQLDWAKGRLSEAGFDAQALSIFGDAEIVIAKTIKDCDIDLLVMGAFGHSMLRRLFFGSKTAELLRASPIPTLLLR